MVRNEQFLLNGLKNDSKSSIFKIMKAQESLSDIKMEIAQLLSSSQDESILSEVRQLLQMPTHDWWDELSESDKAAVDRAEADIAAGRVFSHRDILADLEQWKRE
jgi:hypothetical protein